MTTPEDTRFLPTSMPISVRLARRRHRMEPARLPSMLPTFAPPHEEVRCADLPGNRKIGVAPLHGSRRGPPAHPSQRPRREAITQRRQADTTREEVMREYQQRFAGDGYWAADLKADFNDSNSSTVGT